MEKSSTPVGIARIFREEPFCWQSKEARRVIRDSFDSTHNVNTALSVYDAVTEAQSDAGTDEFTTTHAWLARLSGLSVRTVHARLHDLAELKLIQIRTTGLRAPSTYLILAIRNHCSSDMQPLPNVLQRLNPRSLQRSEDKKNIKRSTLERSEEKRLMAELTPLLGLAEMSGSGPYWRKLIRHFPGKMETAIGELRYTLQVKHLDNPGAWFVDYCKRYVGTLPK